MKPGRTGFSLLPETTVSQVQRRDIDFIFNCHTFDLFQIIKGIFNQLRHVVRQMSVRSPLKIVIIGILGHSTIKERPG